MCSRLPLMLVVPHCLGFTFITCVCLFCNPQGTAADRFLGSLSTFIRGLDTKNNVKVRTLLSNSMYLSDPCLLSCLLMTEARTLYTSLEIKTLPVLDYVKVYQHNLSTNGVQAELSHQIYLNPTHNKCI